MNVARMIVGALIVAILAAGATSWAILSHRQTAELAVKQNAEGAPANVPLGYPPDAAASQTADILNPEAGKPDSVNQGRALFLSMNCAGCHGYDAKGGMGPDLTDKYWRYGGSAAQIYKSIYEGRPKGMPAWGQLLPSLSVWQLTAYVESLGGGVPPSSALTANSQGMGAAGPK